MYIVAVACHILYFDLWLAQRQACIAFVERPRFAHRGLGWAYAQRNVMRCYFRFFASAYKITPSQCDQQLHIDLWP